MVDFQTQFKINAFKFVSPERTQPATNNRDNYRRCIPHIFSSPRVERKWTSIICLVSSMMLILPPCLESNKAFWSYMCSLICHRQLMTAGQRLWSHSVRISLGRRICSAMASRNLPKQQKTCTRCHKSRSQGLNRVHLHRKQNIPQEFMMMKITLLTIQTRNLLSKDIIGVKCK